MSSINFGIGSQAVPVSQVILEFVQQVKTQELRKIGNFIQTEEEQLLHGQPGSIIDLYA